MTLEKALILAITALAAVVTYLFKHALSVNKEKHASDLAMQKERDGWVLERSTIHADHKRAIEKLEENHHRELDERAHDGELREAEMRLDFEKRWRELLERSDQAARRESEKFIAHEDQVRKEFAVIMERVAEGSEKSSAAVVQLMQKMFERFTGPRNR